MAVYINRQDKISQTALDYLQEQYGIPSGDIRSLEGAHKPDKAGTVLVRMGVSPLTAAREPGSSTPGSLAFRPPTRPA